MKYLVLLPFVGAVLASAAPSDPMAIDRPGSRIRSSETAARQKVAPPPAHKKGLFAPAGLPNLRLQIYAFGKPAEPDHRYLTLTGTELTGFRYRTWSVVEEHRAGRLPRERAAWLLGGIDDALRREFARSRRWEREGELFNRRSFRLRIQSARLQGHWGGVVEDTPPAVQRLLRTLGEEWAALPEVPLAPAYLRAEAAPIDPQRWRSLRESRKIRIYPFEELAPQARTLAAECIRKSPGFRPLTAAQAELFEPLRSHSPDLFLSRGEHGYELVLYRPR